jgi:hypothetical protein
MSTAAIIGLVVFILLILGIIGYAATRGRGTAPAPTNGARASSQ